MPRDVHRRGTMVLSVALIVIGIAIVVRTIHAGGSPVSVGVILGVLFVLAGAGRLWVTTRGSSS